MSADVIDLRASSNALLVIEARVARIHAKIDLGDYGSAEDDIEDLRWMRFVDGVSGLVRREARNAADALTAELNVRRKEA